MSSQTLSFTLRVADSNEDFMDACKVRAAGYGHHIPGLKEAFAEPDEIDTSPGTAVLICHDKRTAEPVGTARVQTTTRGAALPIETCVELPFAMASRGRAEMTRLSTIPGADLMVKLALWKAGYLYCHANQAKWLLIGARNEALARQYRRLGATHLHEDRRMVPLTYAGGIAHHVLSFDVIGAERNWFESNNALFGFMFETVHQDIQIFPSDHPAARQAAVVRAGTQSRFAPSGALSILLQQHREIGGALDRQRCAR